jgi:hypothetical protein
MNQPSSTVARNSPFALFLFLKAMRCWTEAQRARKPALPELHARLGHLDFPQLLPAIDSLLTISQALLDRRLRTGSGTTLTRDENLLIDLLQGRPVSSLAHICSDAMACTFCSALRSVQILMDMEMGQAAPEAMAVRSAA